MIVFYKRDGWFEARSGDVRLFVTKSKWQLKYREYKFTRTGFSGTIVNEEHSGTYTSLEDLREQLEGLPGSYPLGSPGARKIAFRRILKSLQSKDDCVFTKEPLVEFETVNGKMTYKKANIGDLQILFNPKYNRAQLIYDDVKINFKLTEMNYFFDDNDKLLRAFRADSIMRRKAREEFRGLIRALETGATNL